MFFLKIFDFFSWDSNFFPKLNFLLLHFLINYQQPVGAKLNFCLYFKNKITKNIDFQVPLIPNRWKKTNVTSATRCVPGGGWRHDHVWAWSHLSQTCENMCAWWCLKGWQRVCLVTPTPHMLQDVCLVVVDGMIMCAPGHTYLTRATRWVSAGGWRDDVKLA